MLLGRHEERSAIDRLLDSARHDTSGTLVLAGEPGIGKSALLGYARESADTLRVAQVAGVEAEVDLGYAGLHRMLRPLLGMLGSLPEPQRLALGAAFGLVTGEPPDRFLVSLAALTLLADAAAERPLLCTVDDVQWMDQESMAVLTFVARRLHADRIALLFAVRTPTARADSLVGFDRLTLEGLGDLEAVELLSSSAPVTMDPRVARRALAEMKGNPLALTELGRQLTVEQSTGASALPFPLPLGDRLEAWFLDQVRGLPTDTQTLLLVAAAEGAGDPDVVRRAAAALDVGPDAADPAEGLNLAVFRPLVEFRHPLVRSAIYNGADPADRRQAHRALAEATDRDLHAERRALHLASACVEPDEAVAVELVQAAVRARARGGFPAEASLLAQAADLSPDETRRAHRQLAAAQAALSGGNPRRARSLLERVSPDLPDAVLRATARRLEGLLKSPLGQPALGPAILLDAARAWTSLDRATALTTYLDAFDSYVVSFSLSEGTTGDELARAALDFLDGEDAEPDAARLLLRAVTTLISSGDRGSLLALRTALTGLRDAEISSEDLLRWMLITPLVANELFDAAAYRALMIRLERMARDRGALAALQMAVLNIAASDTHEGRFTEAGERYAEMLEITRMIGGYVDFFALIDVYLVAWRGDDELARAKASKLIEQALVAGSHAAAAEGWLALALLSISQGRYREAFDWANRVLAGDAPGNSCRALPDVIEAATRCGERAAAVTALASLELRATVSGVPTALGLLARSQALLADDDDAESLYRTAIEQLGSTDWATELARAHLVYGEWLRRRQRRVDARAELRTAHEMFVDMGAKAFAERARAELVATGETVRKRTVETALDLTPQEAQIARLAADRATSREIATQLFISSKTVEYHLSKVFRKLGVTSRRDLAGALSGTP